MSHFIAFVVGLLVFLGWVRLVGNPHVVETVIGLVLGIAAGLWVYFKLKKVLSEKSKSSSKGSS